jgi:hypothetical protein
MSQFGSWGLVTFRNAKDASTAVETSWEQKGPSRCLLELKLDSFAVVSYWLYYLQEYSLCEIEVYG